MSLSQGTRLRRDRRAFFCCLLAGGAIAAGLPAQVAGEASDAPLTLVITGGTLLDVSSGDHIEDSSILVQGERIRAVGKAGSLKLPAHRRTIRARGKWIIPGLIDMHTHETSRSELPLALYVANGVTTIRDLGGGSLVGLRLTREEIRSGRKVGPRIFFAGWALEAPLVNTPGRAQSTVDFLVDQGADVIKVYRDLTEEVLEAIILAAHRRGKRVTGHVPSAVSMTRAVELGMDGLEHIRITAKEFLPAQEADRLDSLPYVEREIRIWQRLDLESDQTRRLVSLLAARKVVLDPTLAIEEYELLGAREDQINDPRNRFLPRELFDEWVVRARQPDPTYRLPPELEEVARTVVEKRARFVAMCAAAGVPIVAGTDGAWLGKVLPGFGLHHELEALVAVGLTPVQAIQAATIHAAQALGREEDLGSVAPGRLADLVLLDADPTEDIGNARKIHLILQGGRIYYPDELKRLVPAD